jgi:hypothetical protein
MSDCFRVCVKPFVNVTAFEFIVSHIVSRFSRRAAENRSRRRAAGTKKV